ncbi:MAG: hypothetical protein IIC27_04050, partial [Chloroflexi bacterium]|nr:hypothetical protein [Chloroflexota bacterium]
MLFDSCTTTVRLARGDRLAPFTIQHSEDKSVTRQPIDLARRKLPRDCVPLADAEERQPAICQRYDPHHGLQPCVPATDAWLLRAIHARHTVRLKIHDKRSCLSRAFRIHRKQARVSMQHEVYLLALVDPRHDHGHDTTRQYRKALGPVRRFGAVTAIDGQPAIWMHAKDRQNFRRLHLDASAAREDRLFTVMQAMQATNDRLAEQAKPAAPSVQPLDMAEIGKSISAAREAEDPIAEHRASAPLRQAEIEKALEARQAAFDRTQADQVNRINSLEGEVNVLREAARPALNRAQTKEFLLKEGWAESVLTDKAVEAVRVASTPAYQEILGGLKA